MDILKKFRQLCSHYGISWGKKENEAELAEKVLLAQEEAKKNLDAEAAAKVKVNPPTEKKEESKPVPVKQWRC